MLIGIDASRANRDHKTGTEWYSYYLIRWLAKLDKKNQYILYADKPLKDGLLDLTTEQFFNNTNNEEIKFDKDNYQILKSPYNNFRAKVLAWPFSFFWTLGRLSLEMLFHEPDILFIPAHTMPLISPKKTINTIHDVAFARDKYLYRHDAMGPEDRFLRKVINVFVKCFTLGKYGANSMDYLDWSTRFALKHAKKIITVSNFSKKEMVEIYNADKTKIKVVYNGYNKHIYKKINNPETIKQVLKKYGITGPYIFYVGRLDKKKNMPALIEAYAIVCEEHQEINHKLVLVGDASYGYDEVKYAIREYDLVDKVIMPGWVNELDLPYFYSGATVFIFPSRHEGFGIPLLQAMACGTPIAASDKTSIPEVVQGAALLFDADNIRPIADALTKVILDNKLREKLIERGLKQVKNFSWEKCAKDTLNEIMNM